MTWSFIYVGLKNNWLNTKEAIQLIEENKSQLKYDEDFLIDLFVNIDDKNYISSKILSQTIIDERKGMEEWMHLKLMQIRDSSVPLMDKLKQIEIEWSKFGYPPEWSEFIYYMPNKQASNPQDLYLDFLNYLKRKET